MPTRTSRKERIVSAAVRCYVENGVAETTMSQIAQRAKVDQPLIHYYFPDVDGLYREVFLVVLESLKEASVKPFALPTKNTAKTLATYIEAPFRWADREPGLFSVWMYFYYLSSFHALQRQLNTDIRRTGRERIAVMIYQGIEEGVFKIPAGSNVQDTALMIQGLITGNTILAQTEDIQERDQLMSQTVTAAYRLLGYSKR